MAKVFWPRMEHGLARILETDGWIGGLMDDGFLFAGRITMMGVSCYFGGCKAVYLAARSLTNDKDMRQESEFKNCGLRGRKRIIPLGRLLYPSEG